MVVFKEWLPPLYLMTLRNPKTCQNHSKDRDDSWEFFIHKSRESCHKFVHRTFCFAFEPFHDATLVKFAQTFQACQFVPNVVLDHADRTLLWTTVLANAVFLVCNKWQHVDSCLGRTSSAFSLIRRISCSDTIHDMCFPHGLVTV
jgi:hypothetical protein